MNKQTLNELFAKAIYRIPDYQRGYAWEETQWKDFIEDIDALVDEHVYNHYTGTVVVYAPRNVTLHSYGTKQLKRVDVVDGQQRLTTSCLYLSIILRELIQCGEIDYERDVVDFLYSGATCKLTLSNDTDGLFYDLLKTGQAHTPAQSPHQKRLVAAHGRFKDHIKEQLEIRGENGVAYLKELHAAITSKLGFTYYEIEEEHEIGMTFELMNSRGKDLSVLELLKNYLMHWISRNGATAEERSDMTTLVNKNWKDTYTNIGLSSGNEDQCLRIAWTLYCSYPPANWAGYAGFKGDEYIPLRNFSRRSKEDTKAFILKFVDGLAEISRHYATIVSPNQQNTLSKDELTWLEKIHNTENLANFLPLMVAARIHRQAGNLAEVDYIDLLKSIECYAYRVFLFGRKRSNAGKSSFYMWGYQVFRNQTPIQEIIAGVYALIRYYASEQSFINELAMPGDWYATRRRLRYTLFEYEIHLLATEGKDKEPALKWHDLNDSTIEHILPQTPKSDSRWKKVWSKQDFNTCLNDIANLVLTQNNSNYLNFEFERKKGQPGQSPSYANSDIRQERRVAIYPNWTREEFDQRRDELIAWISRRWKTEAVKLNATLEVRDEDDEDGLVTKEEGQE